MSNEVAMREAPGAVVKQEPEAKTPQEVVAQMEAIQQLMKLTMREGEHFGTIPGAGSKKTLLKAGAEKLCFMFRLAPSYHHVSQWKGNHLLVESTCQLTHVPAGAVYGSGSGMCSTLESKYRWRQGKRTCPACGNDSAIIKGREEYGGGWICFAKKGGCGAKFRTGDKAIEGQAAGRVENEDLADLYNTIVKMADKRSLVAACLNTTAASDIFTQDLEDLQESLRSVAAAPEVEHADIDAAFPPSEAARAASAQKTLIPEVEGRRNSRPAEATK